MASWLEELEGPPDLFLALPVGRVGLSSLWLKARIWEPKIRTDPAVGSEMGPVTEERQRHHH